MKAAVFSFSVVCLFVLSAIFYRVLTHSQDYRQQALVSMKQNWISALNQGSGALGPFSDKNGQKFQVDPENTEANWNFVMEKELLVVEIQHARIFDLSGGAEASMENLVEIWPQVVPVLQERIAKVLKLEKTQDKISIPIPKSLSQ
jgi:hypothetical protein